VQFTHQETRLTANDLQPCLHYEPYSSGTKLFGNEQRDRAASWPLVDYSFFHHQQRPFGDPDVLGRIAGYGDDVGESSDLQ
jgi:hypothetical protein